MGVAQAAWFGAPCPGPALIPIDDHEIFLRLRTHEADPGYDEPLRLLRGGRIQVRPETLSGLKLSVPDGRSQPDGSGGYWQSLDDVPGLEYRYDSCTQELLLDLSRTRRAANIVVAETGTRLPQPALVPGGFLNLDVQAVSGDQSSFAGISELGAFAGSGHGALTLLQRGPQTLRLDTQWIFDRPQTQTQWVLGDSIAREAPGRRAVRFGGFSWGREFSLRPDIVTFPLPSLRGDAVLPSSVEVYVDGVLRQREDVPPGPFELQSVPVNSGGGQMRAVVRDLLGREQVLAQPFYVTPILLREGLSDYRLEAGWLRKAYGARANDYGPAFAAAVYRLGWDPTRSVTVHMDADELRQSVGTGLVAQLGHWGAASAEIAASRSDQGEGMHGALGYSQNAGLLSVSLELRAASEGYAALGDEQKPAHYVLSARAGAPMPGGGSVSVTAIAQSSRSPEVMTGESQDAAQTLRVFSLNYSGRLATHWLLGAQLSHTRTQRDDWIAGLGLTWVLGSVSSASAYVQGGVAETARLGWQRQSEEVLGWSYQVDVEHAPALAATANRALGQLRWTQERGVMSAAVETGAGKPALRYGLQTGLAWMGTSLFSGRPVQGSFAVVEVGDVEGVRVFHDHQLVARTDAEGIALVPDLRPYEPNTLSFQLSDLPIEQRADAEEVTVIPYARSGMAVRFPVAAAAQDRWLRLRRADGRWLPDGASIRVIADQEGGRPEILTGTDGRVLLRGVPDDATLEAVWPDGSCRTQLRPQYKSAENSDTILLCGPY